MLRVRTGPEKPESNLRELTRDGNLNCGIARERGRKLTCKKPKLKILPAHSQNKGRTEQFQRTASLLWTGLSPTRGRRQGRGVRGKLSPREGISYQTANRLPVSNQTLPELLDG